MPSLDILLKEIWAKDDTWCIESGVLNAVFMYNASGKTVYGSTLDTVVRKVWSFYYDKECL